MASFPLIFSFLCLVAKLCHAQSPVSFVIPVTKDNSTLQYLTTLSYGTPLLPTKLVLDLGGPFLWLDCASRNMPSSSTLTTPHRSIQCLTAKTHEAEATSFLSSPTDQDQYQPCQVFPENSITGTVATEGEFVQDLMSLQSTHKLETIHQVRFTCSPSMLLNGLARGAKGMVGLGRSRCSLTSQVFDSFGTHRKLTLCLSSSTGVILFGNMDYESPSGAEILRSLTFTPLITNQNQRYPSQEYFVNVNSIKINGKRLSFNTSSKSQDEEDNNGGTQTQLSSIVPYTTMQSSIYAIFKTAFVDAAMSMNMTRLASVAPFELCFSYRGIGRSQVGPSVPIIELVLQSEMVKWSIYGRNSMVRVSNEIMCLGFLDGGVNPRNPIVIGGYQLEDVIVQFDLATSMVGFSSSLLTKNTRCSDFKFGSIHAASV
ncbi:probable aspartic proteinase GIP2 [Gastrolobium bilobum]|uniref:probable aspartic proteinase GIP2 n=1 Tax=Gastrolobium bilobum TaxID=150636 RepID=UPI002AB2C087|nr:probable aspartic proteinase GIP2 [Gastrolobium bilobum]